MNGKTPSTDPTLDALLKSSIQAAERLRKEQGLLARIMVYLERKSEMRHELKKLKLQNKQKQAALARCRKGEHDVQNWTVGQKTTIYAHGSDPKKALPVHYQQSWIGHCVHCGVPEIVKKNI